MPIYFYWGDDDFSMNRAIAQLRDRTIDAAWESFNYQKIPPEQPDAVTQALNEAMTPPFGMGSRLVWLAETTVCQRCPENLLAELERTLPQIPDSTVLLLTSSNKPDGRLKSTKLLQKQAEVREFASIPPWKTEQLVQQVRNAAKELDVRLDDAAAHLLADAVGNDMRQLFNELEKLKLYAGEGTKPLGEAAIATMVTVSTQSSLQLAAAIRAGETGKALTLIADLFSRNEAALRIVSTLVGQFRTWLWVKLMVASGERSDSEIARLAEVGNPKRVYFLKQEVRSLSLDALQQSLPLLLELEHGLKQGADPLEWFQTKTIELCELFRQPSR